MPAKDIPKKVHPTNDELNKKQAKYRSEKIREERNAKIGGAIKAAVLVTVAAILVFPESSNYAVGGSMYYFVLAVAALVGYNRMGPF